MSPLPRRTPVLRPSLRTSLRTLFVTTLSAAVASVALGAPAQAGNRVTPGNFTGYGFDQCLAPSQAAMDAWLASSPSGRWHLHLWRLACLPRPAEPDPTWVSTQLAKRLAAAADHGRSAGLMLARVPGTREDRIIARTERRYRRRASRGARGRQDGGPPRRPRHREAARSGTTSRPSTSAAPVPRVGLSSSGRGLALHHARLRLRRLLQRRLRHQDPRQRPETGPTTCSPTGSGSPVGTASPTSSRHTSVTTAGIPTNA